MVVAISSSERDGIAETFARMRARLGTFIRRRVADENDAEDILQDVFRELIEAYRLPAPIEQVSAWLYRVARNRIIDRFRKRKELRAGDPGAEAPADDRMYRLEVAIPMATGDEPEAAYQQFAFLRALERALDELPQPQREVFLAHEIRGMSFKDMSAESGVPINTLLARKRHAVLFLRERLRAAYEELDI